MKEFNSLESLIFIHIPKAGGTSLRQVLKLWYLDNLKLHYFDEANNKLPQKHELEPRVCICGHFNAARGFGIEHYYPQAKQFATFMRDPFELIVSRYYYVKKKERDGTSFINGRPTSLPTNVNLFLKDVIRNPDYSPNILNFFPRKLSLSNFKQIIDRSFVFIGFLDNYQDSLNHLADILGFPRMPAPFENKSERFGEVDHVLRETFIREHPLEYEVYHYARQKFLPGIQSLSQ